MSSTEKGFSLLEMLIAVMMIASLAVVALSYREGPDLEHYRFLNDYLLIQSEALSERRERVYENGIRFNSMGHIDLARTVEFRRKKITLNLGSGYALIR